MISKLNFGKKGFDLVIGHIVVISTGQFNSADLL